MQACISAASYHHCEVVVLLGRYFIQAEEIVWDYAPLGKNALYDRPFDDSEKVFVSVRNTFDERTARMSPTDCFTLLRTRLSTCAIAASKACTYCDRSALRWSGWLALTVHEEKDLQPGSVRSGGCLLLAIAGSNCW